jgi:hypothetical protein
LPGHNKEEELHPTVGVDEVMWRLLPIKNYFFKNDYFLLKLHLLYYMLNYLYL